VRARLAERLRLLVARRLGRRRDDATFGTLGGTPRTPALARAVAVAQQTVQVRTALAPLAAVKEEALPPTPVAYPATDTGKGLRNLARMLGAGLGVRVATVRAAGRYDTHDDQPAQHGTYLADLGDSLVAWQADLRPAASTGAS
jgi:uncharacterized protein (DUF1501 family)